MNFNIVICIFINKGMLAIVVTMLLSCLFESKEFGWKSLGFVIWGVLVLWELIGVWVGRNLGFEDGGESWIRCRPIAAFPVATNRPIGGVGAFVQKLGAASGWRRPQQPLLLDPPPNRASDLVSSLLLRRSQFHQTPMPTL